MKSSSLLSSATNVTRTLAVYRHAGTGVLRVSFYWTGDIAGVNQVPICGIDCKLGDQPAKATKRLLAGDFNVAPWTDLSKDEVIDMVARQLVRTLTTKPL